MYEKITELTSPNEQKQKSKQKINSTASKRVIDIFFCTFDIFSLPVNNLYYEYNSAIPVFECKISHFIIKIGGQIFWILPDWVHCTSGYRNRAPVQWINPHLGKRIHWPRAGHRRMQCPLLDSSLLWYVALGTRHYFAVVCTHSMFCLARTIERYKIPPPL